MRALARLSGANLVGPVTAIVVSPILARTLGVDGRGIYAALTIPILMLGIAGTLGVQDGFAVFIAQRGLPPRRALRYLWSVLPIASLVTIAAGAAIGLGLFRHAPAHVLRWYLLLLLVLPLQIAFNMSIGLATGSADIVGVNRARIAPAVVRSIVIITLCGTVSVSPMLAALVLLLSVAVGLAWIVVRCLRSEQGGDSIDPIVRRKDVLMFSLVAFPGVLASISTARIDQIVGLPLIGAKQLGLYAVAVSLAEIPMVAATGARTLLLGMPIAGEDLAMRQQLIRRVTGLVTVACGTLAIGVWLLVPVVFGKAFGPAVPPALILLAATVVYTAGTCMSAVLLSLGKAAIQSMALLFGAAASVAALIAFKSHGAVGAAWASAVGYVVTATVCFVSLRRGRDFRLRDTVLPDRGDIRWAIGVLVGALGRAGARGTP